MMDSMKHIMQVSDNAVVGQNTFAMEDEAVDEVLGEREGEKAYDKNGQHEEKVEIGPINFGPIAGEQNDGDNEDVVPLIM